MIEVHGLSKRFATGEALRGVDLRVEPGEVCGLIGPNGAGKTTLLRILATVLRPTRGKVIVAGCNARSEADAVRRRIGYMPDNFGTYEELRVDAYLEFFGRVYRLPRQELWQTIDDILRLVDLYHLRNATISRLSLGARQRLGLSRVLLHGPDVLLLDEPVSGLDPRARVEMRELLRELGTMGKTVLISSHVLTDLADLCDRLVVLEKGEVIFAGSFAELKEKVTPDRIVEVAVDTDVEPLLTFIGKQPWARSVRRLDGKAAVEFTLTSPPQPLSAVSADLFAQGFRLTRFVERQIDLEQAFLRLTKGTVS